MCVVMMVYYIRCPGVKVCGDGLSPVIHLRLTTPNSNREEDERQLSKVAEFCLEHGVAVVTAKYLSEEVCMPPARQVTTNTHGTRLRNGSLNFIITVCALRCSLLFIVF